MFNLSAYHLTTCLQILKTTSYENYLIAADVNPADFERMQADAPFLPSERSKFRNILDRLIFGSVDLQGLPRPVVPAEYVAACIVAFVHPVNYMAVSQWYDGQPDTSSLIAAENPEAAAFEGMSGSRIFAMCVQFTHQNDDEELVKLKKGLASAFNNALKETDRQTTAEAKQKGKTGIFN